MSSNDERHSDAIERKPRDGESYDQNGTIRPVPPCVPNKPEEETR
jgi:hypothetical protein